MGVLEGKVAIVTGAGTGIGEGEAYALAKEGASVVVVGRRLGKVETVANTIKGFGGEALALKCDVCIRDDVNNVVLRTIETYGQIDILVNNAQIMPGEGRGVEEWREQELRDMWESGYLGSWFFMVECFPHMKGRGGKIINTTSAAGHGIIPGLLGYGSAKEAVRNLTRYAAREWGQHKINVNVISPSAFSEAAGELYPTEESQQAMLAEYGVPIRRFGLAEEDIGRTVVFLSGPDSDMITGCTISCDGGVGMI